MLVSGRVNISESKNHPKTYQISKDQRNHIVGTAWRRCLFGFGPGGWNPRWGEGKICTRLVFLVGPADEGFEMNVSISNSQRHLNSLACFRVSTFPKEGIFEFTPKRFENLFGRCMGIGFQTGISFCLQS